MTGLPTAYSSGRMLSLEMRTDVMPDALDTCSPADDPVEAAQVPTLLTQAVLPEALWWVGRMAAALET